MDSSNKRKYELLGIPYGTAQHQLRKKIMFEMMQKLERDICYRCNKKIDNIDELSVEHKEAWQQAENPIDAFYNLDNIAFSHLKCNMNAAKKPEKQPIIHGTVSGYEKGCRCDGCRNAKRLRAANYRKNKHPIKNKERKFVEKAHHGTTTGYKQGCRCEECTKANSLYKRKWTKEARNKPTPHGTLGGYQYWNCRCEECTKAGSVLWKKK